MKKPKTSHAAAIKADKLRRQRKQLNSMLTIYADMLVGKFNCPAEELPQHTLTMQQQIISKCNELAIAVAM